MIKHLTFLVLISLLLFSCSKEENPFPNIPKEGVYFTDHIWVNPALDLNRDGVKSENLIEEALYSPFHLTVDNREDQGYRFFDFGYPYLYTDSNDPDFLNLGSNSMYSTFKLDKNILVADNPNILSAILVNDSTLQITSIAEFDLIEGKKQVQMKATYKWASK